MKRGTKQLFFGAVYVLIIGVLLLGAFFSFFAKYPTCFDALQNQEEEGIDCGGPCMLTCERQAARIVAREVQVLSAGEKKTSLVVPVTNTTQHYGVYRFDFTFEVFSEFETKLGTFAGVSSLEPGETKYIVVPNISLDPRDIARATFTTASPEWRESSALPTLSFETKDLKTTLRGDGIEATGTVENTGASASGKIRSIGVLFGKDGSIIAVSGTTLASIPAFDSAPFTVFFPRTAEIVQKMDHSRTQIFYEAERL